MGPKLLNAYKTSHIRLAANILKKGGLVAFPTETVYGLGADALNAKAVCRIFEVKKRPAFDPLIVHVSDPKEAMKLWKETPSVAVRLMKKFWPGPLTLVLPKSKLIPDVVTAGFSTVAVRMPDHSAALSLIRALGHPIAAPSANTFGFMSPTSAQDVREDLGKAIEGVLDGGNTKIGVESTVLKIEKGRGILLRPGGITVEEIREVIRVEKNIPQKKERHGSPGLLTSHYAPRHAPLFLMDQLFQKELEAYLKALDRKRSPLPRIGLLSMRPKKSNSGFYAVRALSRRGDLYEAASNLFQAMRKLDKMSLAIILAETVPTHGIGLAILDRLKKASGGKTASKDLLNKIRKGTYGTDSKKSHNGL